VPLRISGGPRSQTDLSSILPIHPPGTAQIDKFGSCAFRAMKNSTILLAFSDVLLPWVLTLSSLDSRFIEVDIFILRGICSDSRRVVTQASGP
jgi:hypothetical protein